MLRRLSRSSLLLFLALLVPAAGASAADFHSAADYPVSLQAEEIEALTMTVESVKIECTEVTLEGGLEESSEEATMSPTFGGCKAFGSVNATVTANGCTFVLAAGEETAADNFGGEVDIACPESNQITVVAGTCEVKIGSQESLGSVDYVDNTGASPPDVTVDLGLTGVAVTKKDGFLCPFFSSGPDTAIVAGELLLGAEAEAEAAALAIVEGTRLCKEAPNGAGVCPKGKGYAGTVEGALLNAPAKLPAHTAGKVLLGEIECGESTLKGNFLEDGTGAPGEGITSFKLTTGGGACTSTLAGAPAVTITLGAMPWGGSRFKYLPAGGATGTLAIRKKWNNTQVVMTVVIAGKAPCDLRLSEPNGTVTNGGAKTKLKLNLTWELKEGGAHCPATIAWPNLEWELTIPGVGPLYLGKQVAA